MFQQLITLNEFNRGYLNRLLADMPPERIDDQLADGLHSVRWILAHLAIAADYGLKQLDLPFVCPMTWHVAYGPSSQAGTSDRIKPTHEELMATIEHGYSTLCHALRSVDDERLAVPHEVELLKSTNLKTKADLVSHILATHFATHLGQLSTLRRMMGLPALF